MEENHLEYLRERAKRLFLTKPLSRNPPEKQKVRRNSVGFFLFFILVLVFKSPGKSLLIYNLTVIVREKCFGPILCGFDCSC